MVYLMTSGQSAMIQGIRRVSDADILLLKGTPYESPVQPVYQVLGYNSAPVLMLDAKGCIWVEVVIFYPKATTNLKRTTKSGIIMLCADSE